MKLEPQVEQLCRTLDRELDNFPAGVKFYSVRKLLDKFKCHRRVLDEALERLEKDQLISRVPQVGIFSNVTRRPDARKVLLMLPDWPSELVIEWGVYATQYTENHPGWQLNKILLTPDRDSICSITTEGYDAAILMMPSTSISRPDMLWLASQSIPMVLLNVDTGSFEISNIKSADADGAALACQYFHRKGHRRIALVQSEPHALPAMERISAFVRMADFLEMETIMIDCLTSSGEFAQHKAYLGMKNYLEEHDGRIGFTAVYSVSGESVPGIMAALREYHYELPDDVGIMAHSTEQVGQYYHPALTAVCADPKAEVEAAFSGLAAQLDGHCPAFKTTIPMKIMERASVRTCNPIN